MQVNAKTTTSGGVVTATLARDGDGWRAVRLTGASGAHLVSCADSLGGWARAVGHLTGYLQEACYGLTVEQTRTEAERMVAGLRAQVDAEDRPLLSVEVTASTGYVRVSGRNRAGKLVPVATAKAHRKGDGVGSYVRKGLSAPLAAAVEAAYPELEALARSAKQRARRVAADKRAERGSSPRSNVRSGSRPRAERRASPYGW